MRLDTLPPRTAATVHHVEWDTLSTDEGRRLRELGLEVGADIELLHKGGLLGRGPIACRIGRMIVAMRANHAHAISVEIGTASNGAAA